MRLWRTDPGALRVLGGVRIGAAFFLGWIAPLPVGVALFLAARLSPPEGAVHLALVATALTFAPAFSWTGMILLVPLSLALIARGWFGAAPATIAGACSGAVAGWAVGGIDPVLPVVIGVGAGLVTHAALRALAPEKNSVPAQQR